MKSTKKVLWIVLPVFVLLVLLAVGNEALTRWIDSTNEACPGQRFFTLEDAIAGMENAVDPNDTSLDYVPPYKLLTSFEYDEFTVILYAYQWAPSNQCLVRMLHKNEDGTLSFVGGFTHFYFISPAERDRDYYFFTNVPTSHGVKTISFLYLPADSTSKLFVDGKEAEMIPVRIDDEEFFVCAALSRKDTFFKNLFTPIGERHTIKLK